MGQECTAAVQSCMDLTIINNSSQHAALLLVDLLIVGEALQVSEAGCPLGTWRTFTGLVFHTGLWAVSPTWTRSVLTHTQAREKKGKNIKQGNTKLRGAQMTSLRGPR